MSELISGKEAKLAWANGVELEFHSPDLGKWFGLNDEPFMSDVFETRKIRIKPKTITLNGIEVPAPFEPKEGDMVWCLNELSEKGYEARTAYDSNDFTAHISYWRTEDEIKQVVSALRSIFKGEVK